MGSYKRDANHELPPYIAKKIKDLGDLDTDEREMIIKKLYKKNTEICIEEGITAETIIAFADKSISTNSNENWGINRNNHGNTITDKGA